VDIVVDNYIRFLEITPQQEQKIKEQLENARNIFIQHYTKLDSIDTGMLKLSENALLDYRISMLTGLDSIIHNINNVLTEKQRSIFVRSELFYYFMEARNKILKDYADNNELSHELVVNPSEIPADVESEVNSEEAYAWTIYFGQNMLPFFSDRSRDSVSKSARGRFNIGVQATLVNNFNRDSNNTEESKTDIFNKKKTTEINVILFSSIHPSFTDINRWVVYLELQDGTQIEPATIEEISESWFENRNLLPENRIPKFLMNRESTETRTTRARQSYYPDAFKLNRTYYKLLFPYAVNGVPLISHENSFIRLIFLEEVGSTKSARGTWHFQWY